MSKVLVVANQTLAVEEISESTCRNGDHDRLIALQPGGRWSCSGSAG